ncbi:MAG: NRDE family protein [Acidimicrobiales bacterium]
MCTVLLRFAPGDRWPVLLGAVRDEFADRPWDPPAAHWGDRWPDLLGGRDRAAGGTWLALDPSPHRPAVAALLNGIRRAPTDDGTTRPTRGTLALDALSSGTVPDATTVADYDGFHLLVATLAAVEVWSWNTEHLSHRSLDPGDHLLVNLGVDVLNDPLVPHFGPLLAALPNPTLTPGETTSAAWGPWVDLLRGDGLDPEDPRALIVRRDIEGRTYRSTSASLVALSADAVRYDFTGDPTDPSAWDEVPNELRS